MRSPATRESTTRKSRFTDAPMVKMRREAERMSVGGVAKKHGVSAQTVCARRRPPARGPRLSQERHDMAGRAPHRAMGHRGGCRRGGRRLPAPPGSLPARRTKTAGTAGEPAGASGRTASANPQTRGRGRQAPRHDRRRLRRGRWPERGAPPPRLPPRPRSPRGPGRCAAPWIAAADARRCARLGRDARPPRRRAGLDEAHLAALAALRPGSASRASPFDAAYEGRRATTNSTTRPTAPVSARCST
jgi:hypothetical protein